VSSTDVVRVLLVDDSAVVRGALRQIIDASSDLRVVTTATNGRMALDALRQVSVDVVLLDVEMPEMDGLAALPRIIAEHPNTRVIMASSLTQKGAAVTMQALALGAADFITKPSARSGAQALAALAEEITVKIRLIGAAARRRPLLPMERAATARATPAFVPSVLGGAASDTTPGVLAIASSTGGPNALIEVLGRLPEDFPLPVLIVQHMPPLFTVLLAQRIARETRRSCVEAVNGQPIENGCVYVAPGGSHLVVTTHEGRPYAQLSNAAPENHCRPAADPLFRSVAAVYGPSTLAVVLTGMGEDGCRGCDTVRRRGGRVIVQDEASSVVWGMPGAVVSAGLANHVLPLNQIATRISTLCSVHR
jgi:two-component system, chemotaxis family, protein-glutamate methylesterase/glutaminase